MQALAIMYHDVVENGDFESSGFPGEGAHVYKLRREDFERHLDAIAAATAAVSTVRMLEGRPVLLTFDDGGVSFHHPIADLLERRGWRGHFFITTDRIGMPGFLTEAQLRELHRRGHIIGSHSCSHPTRMGTLTPLRPGPRMAAEHRPPIRGAGRCGESCFRPGGLLLSRGGGIGRRGRDRSLIYVGADGTG